MLAFYTKFTFECRSTNDVQALNQWIDSMDQSLTGKKKAAAKRRQKKWRLSPDEWEMLGKLCAVLEVCLQCII
jgi:hypothetical protein